MCIVLGLFIGYLVLLIINPTGAGDAILTVIKNFCDLQPQASTSSSISATRWSRRRRCCMCALSILFAYKVGLFNIGAAGQYCRRRRRRRCTAALALQLPWYVCVMLAAIAGRRAAGRHLRRC